MKITGIISNWCREAESNHRHEDFQSTALPTELSRHFRMRGIMMNNPLFVNPLFIESAISFTALDSRKNRGRIYFLLKAISTVNPPFAVSNGTAR